MSIGYSEGTQFSKILQFLRTNLYLSLIYFIPSVLISPSFMFGLLVGWKVRSLLSSPLYKNHLCLIPFSRRGIYEALNLHFIFYLILLLIYPLLNELTSLLFLIFEGKSINFWQYQLSRSGISGYRTNLLMELIVFGLFVVRLLQSYAGFILVFFIGALPILLLRKIGSALLCSILIVYIFRVSMDFLFGFFYYLITPFTFNYFECRINPATFLSNLMSIGICLAGILWIWRFWRRKFLSGPLPVEQND